MYTYFYLLSENVNIEMYVQICSYIQNYTQKLIDILEITSSNPEHTQNSMLHFKLQQLSKSENPLFQKLDIRMNLINSNKSTLRLQMLWLLTTLTIQTAPSHPFGSGGGQGN